MSRRKRILFVAASIAPLAIFLKRQINELSVAHEVVLATNVDFPFDNCFLKEVKVKRFEFERKPNVFRDLMCLFALSKYMNKFAPDIVVSITPKGGLIAAVSGFTCGVNCRVHYFTGQVWSTRTGILRAILKGLDRITAKLLTHALTDSQSQRRFLVENEIIDGRKISVLGSGSVGGVDLRRFMPNGKVKANIRAELGWPKDSFVFLFLGRLAVDKGVTDLADAFAGMSASTFSNCRLLIVGPDEGVLATVKKRLRDVSDRVSFVPFTPNPEQYMQCSDVLCLPSYREGFGTSVIEAAAVGLPAIGSRIYGLTDAIIDNQTGILFTPGHINELQISMERLATMPILRKKMAREARKRAIVDFDSAKISSLFINYISEIGDLA